MVSTIASLGEGMVEFAAEGVGGPRSQSLFSVGCGGDASNFAVAVSRLGGQASFVTRVGDDQFGKVLLQLWRDELVDSRHVLVDSERPTGVYFILRDDGESHFVYRRTGSAASFLRPADLPSGWVEQADMLHVTGITQAISESACSTVFEAIRRSKAAGRTVSYDPNIRLALWPADTARAIIRHTMTMSDIFLPNIAEGRFLTGLSEPRDVVRQLLKWGAPTVVLKMGSDGALVATADRTTALPAIPARAVDPTGAGDTFDAAFAVATLEGERPVEAAQFAAAAAAKVVQGLGAITPIPTRREVFDSGAEACPMGQPTREKGENDQESHCK